MSALQIRLLGPPQISYDKRPWTVARRQARALLYVLAVDKARWTREQLCSLFWSQRSTSQARRSCSHLLTHLRRALPDGGMVCTEANNVWLRDDVWVDTVAFAHLMRGSVESWRAAAEMIRGPFLFGADLPTATEYEMWLLQEQQRWHLAELTVLKQLVEAETEVGHYEQAIAYAHRYLARDDVAEEMYVRLMQLYALIGDRTTALQQYEQCVMALERELGVDPSPATRAAYDSLLHVSSSRSTPVLAWTTLPSLHVPHIEREAAITSLQEALSVAAQGQGQMVFISGEAGVGKSRMLQEFAAQNQDNARVLYGAATAAWQPLPYETIIQALRGAMTDLSLANLSPVWLGELASLLPELTDMYPDLSRSTPFEDIHAAQHLFEALHQAFTALASRERPLLLCLDDMQWSDAATRDWLIYWGPRLRRSPALVLLAYRTEESKDMAALIPLLARAGVVRTLSLETLSYPATVRLLRHAGLKSFSARQSQRLWEVTGGNPFFVLETARVLLERPLAPEGEEDDWPLPESVAQAIAARLVSLRPPAMQILEAGAVLAYEFDFNTVRAVAGRPEMESLDGLDELVARHLLMIEDGRYRFIHQITRRVVLDRMSQARRRLLHRRAALALSQRGEVSADVVAYHFDVGGDAEKALHFYGSAARRAASIYAWQTAESIYRRMLALLEAVDPECRQQGTRQQRAQILMDRAHMYYLQGRLTERDADLQALYDLARAAADENLLLRTLAIRARYLNLDGDYHAALEAVQQGLAACSEHTSPRLRSHLHAQHGFACYFLGQPHVALQALQQAATAAAKIPDPAVHGRIAQFKGYVYYHLAAYQDALSHHEQALHFHEILGDRNRMAWDLTDMGIMCTQLMRLQEAKTHLQQALQLACEIGSRPAESYALNNLGQVYARQGQYDEALRCHLDSLQLQRATGSRRGEASALIQAASTYLCSGNRDEAVQLLHEAIAICRQINYQMGLAKALSLRSLTLEGELARARAMAQEALRLSRSISAPHNELKALLVQSQLALKGGEGQEALALAQEALSRAEVLDLSAEQVRAKTWAGLACLQMREPARALAYTQAACDQVSALNSTVAVAAMAQLAHGRALAAAGQRHQAACAMIRYRTRVLQLAAGILQPTHRRLFFRQQRRLRRWTARLLKV